MAADSDAQYAFTDEHLSGEESSMITTRGIEAFSRKVTATATHLMSPLADPASNTHYRAAMAEVHKQLQRPTIQRSMFSMARTTPRDIVRSRLSTTEISHRALSYLPDDLLANIPEADKSYSLFQGFQATLPEIEDADGFSARRHRRRVSRGRKMLEDVETNGDGVNDIERLRKERETILRDLELLAIRKNMASSEIRDIDGKIANMHRMRNNVLDRLASFEQDETMMDHEILELDHRLEAAQALFDEEQSVSMHTPTKTESDMTLHDDDDSGFMSQSIYEKMAPSSISSTSSRGRKARSLRRKSMPVLHEHFEPGTAIREMRVHNDAIIALDFDAPFGTMVTSSEDDTVRVWDLNAGRCIGALDRHTASVRALQVEDNILATGSRDATIRLWDLSRAHYDPHGFAEDGELDDEAAIAFEGPDDRPLEPPPGTMADCQIFSLESHVDEVTALHFRGGVLVSGSADKTLRQWDLEKGRCVQTLDVMWAAAQAQASLGDGSWRGSGRSSAVSDADFVGALQVFDAALACGTADGMVRLWDLRSGQVHRSLVGHTDPVTCLQFDDVHLVTTSIDRSVRIWDLRTGSIFDAYAYNHPVTSMMFDQRRIVCAAGEDVVKVYDKLECRQWDCGAGAAGDDSPNKRQAGKTSVVEKVRVRDGYLVEGRRDGIVGVWTC